VLTAGQVFDLAERAGRRPVGNIHKLSSGAYRLRSGVRGRMYPLPHAYATRADVECAPWELAEDGRADYGCDLRYRPLVLVAAWRDRRLIAIMPLTWASCWIG
jgi:hypothetical protein